MRSPLSKPSKTVPPTGTSAKYMFKTCREFSCTYLTKWTDLSDLESHWSLRGTFDIPKLDFLKTKLGNNSAVVKKEEWNAHFEWYIEASKQCYESKVTQLQNKVSVNKGC